MRHVLSIAPRVSLSQSLGDHDSIPATDLRQGKFSVRYCTVCLVRWRYLCVSDVENPSLGRHDTWKSSRKGTESAGKICWMRWSVHRGRSLRPMLVTLKFNRARQRTVSTTNSIGIYPSIWVQPWNFLEAKKGEKSLKKCSNKWKGASGRKSLFSP